MVVNVVDVDHKSAYLQRGACARARESVRARVSQLIAGVDGVHDTDQHCCGATHEHELVVTLSTNGIAGSLD